MKRWLTCSFSIFISLFLNMAQQFLSSGIFREFFCEVNRNVQYQKEQTCSPRISLCHVDLLKMLLLFGCSQELGLIGQIGCISAAHILPHSPTVLSPVLPHCNLTGCRHLNAIRPNEMGVEVRTGAGRGIAQISSRSHDHGGLQCHRKGPAETGPIYSSSMWTDCNIIHIDRGKRRSMKLGSN